jgi:hypothetical protein
VILGEMRAGVRTSSKNFEVTIRWRLGHGPGSPRGRAANGLVSWGSSGWSWGASARLLAAVRDALRPQARFAAQSFTARDWTSIADS